MGYTTGLYAITDKGKSPGADVSAGVDPRTSNFVTNLAVNDVVTILKIERTDTRIRGLVDKPRGWISICSIKAGESYMWAKKIDSKEAELLQAGSYTSTGVKRGVKGPV